MNKVDKMHHDQKLINALNLRLDQVNHVLNNRSLTPFVQRQFENQRAYLIKRLSKLYGTEKYGAVQ